MTRLEIRNLVIEATGRADKTSLINSAINIAVAELSSARLWRDLSTEADLTLAGGEGSVDLPDDYFRLTEARLIISDSMLLSRPILVRPKSWVVRNFPNIEAQSPGKPVYAYLENGKLYFAPFADIEYTIRITYFRLHPSLSSDSSEVLIRQGSQAVVAYATFWTFNSIERSEDATRWFNTYGSLLRSAMQVDGDVPAIEYRGALRGEPTPVNAEYWLDPFVRNAP